MLEVLEDSGAGMTALIVVVSAVLTLWLLWLMFRDPAKLSVDRSRWTPPPQREVPR